jgi:hypothetical protein
MTHEDGTYSQPSGKIDCCCLELTFDGTRFLGKGTHKNGDNGDRRKWEKI